MDSKGHLRPGDGCLFLRAYRNSKVLQHLSLWPYRESQVWLATGVRCQDGCIEKTSTCNCRERKVLR